MPYKKVLVWEKPKKIMTEKDRREQFSSDSDIPGTYVPNMSDKDIRAWKAKLVGHRAGHPQIEIRKDTSVIIVAFHGYKYKHYTPENTKDINIHISSAGPIQWTAKEFDEFQIAVVEAKAVLIEVDKKIQEAHKKKTRKNKKINSLSSDDSTIDGVVVGDIVAGIGELVLEILASIGDAS